MPSYWGGGGGGGGEGGHKLLIQFEFQIQAVWSFLFLRSRPCPRLFKSPLLVFFLVGYGTTFTGRKFVH